MVTKFEIMDINDQTDDLPAQKSFFIRTKNNTMNTLANKRLI